MILKQGHEYRAMPHDGKLIAYIYRGGRCYYKDSPYSLAATQALKAAFPQYFAAIRDYGFAHPQLVPFINEKPTIAAWVCGCCEPNASMYPIQLGLKFSKDFGYTFGATDILEFSFIKLQSSTSWHDFLVARKAWNSSNAIGYIYNWNNNQLLVSTTSGSSQSSCLSPSMNQWYTVKQDMRSGIYVDNVLKISNKKSSTWVSDGALQTIADTQDRIAINVISIYRDDVLIHRYYPIDDNGTWWDVIEAKFY